MRITSIPPDKTARYNLAGRGRNHSGKAFLGCDDPPDPAIPPASREIKKMLVGDITGVDL
jgi:hypothetical protein